MIMDLSLILMVIALEVPASTMSRGVMWLVSGKHSWLLSLRGCYMENDKKHKVSIHLTYIDVGIKLPYKWGGKCTCGWECLSWAWRREEDGSGTLAMSLEHVGLLEPGVIYVYN